MAGFEKADSLRRWQDEDDWDVVRQFDNFLMVETMLSAVHRLDVEVVEQSLHSFLKKSAEDVLESNKLHFEIFSFLTFHIFSMTL